MEIPLRHNETKREILPSTIVKITFNRYMSGSCQCFKDCDCYLNAGKLIGEEYCYTYSGAVYKDTLKQRYFTTEQGALQSLMSK